MTVKNKTAGKAWWGYISLCKETNMVGRCHLKSPGKKSTSCRHHVDRIVSKSISGYDRNDSITTRLSKASIGELFPMRIKLKAARYLL